MNNLRQKFYSCWRDIFWITKIEKENDSISVCVFCHDSIIDSSLIESLNSDIKWIIPYFLNDLISTLLGIEIKSQHAVARDLSRCYLQVENFNTCIINGWWEVGSKIDFELIYCWLFFSERILKLYLNYIFASRMLKCRREYICQVRQMKCYKRGQWFFFSFLCFYCYSLIFFIVWHWQLIF